MSAPDPFQSFADIFGEDLLDDIIDAALAAEFPHNPHRLVRAQPMDLPIKKTLADLCGFFAHYGFGNRYFEDEGEIKVARVKALNLVIEDDAGEERTCLVVLDPQWVNPNTRRPDP